MARGGLRERSFGCNSRSSSSGGQEYPRVRDGVRCRVSRVSSNRFLWKQSRQAIASCSSIFSSVVSRREDVRSMIFFFCAVVVWVSVTCPPST